MNSHINWKATAQTLGLLQSSGEESGSDQSARDALALLLGDDEIRSAVDYYLEGAPGSELARNVLRILRPAVAMDYCLEIYQSASDRERRRAAVELLRVVADARVLPSVSEMLQDPDPGVQLWGLGVIDQLMWGELISHDIVQQYLDMADKADNDAMQSMLQSMREHIAENAALEQHLGDWYEGRS